MTAVKRVKCSWCGKDGVALTAKGLLKPHVLGKGRPCVGNGMRYVNYDAARERAAAAAKIGAKKGRNS